jgi:hypothetical protein
MGSAATFSANKIRGGYTAPAAGQVCKARGRGGPGEFSRSAGSMLALGAAEPGAIGADPAGADRPVRNGGFPPFSDRGSRHVARHHVARHGQGVDLATFSVVCALIANLRTGGGQGLDRPRRAGADRDGRGGGVPLRAARAWSYTPSGRATGSFENLQVGRAGLPPLDGMAGSGVGQSSLLEPGSGVRGAFGPASALTGARFQIGTSGRGKGGGHHSPDAGVARMRAGWASVN